MPRPNNTGSCRCNAKGGQKPRELPNTPCAASQGSCKKPAPRHHPMAASAGTHYPPVDCLLHEIRESSSYRYVTPGAITRLGAAKVYAAWYCRIDGHPIKGFFRWCRCMIANFSVLLLFYFSFPVVLKLFLLLCLLLFLLWLLLFLLWMLLGRLGRIYLCCVTRRNNFSFDIKHPF